MTATAQTAPRTEELDDACVIAQSWHEPEMFSVLFRRHAAEMHRYVTRRLGRSAADDVVGETFLVAFRRRGRYDTERPDARPWLYGIASRLVGRHRRAEVRMYRALSRTGLDPVAESYADQIEARVDAAGVERELAAALAALAKGDRDVLLLFAWAELSYDEIGIALGIPVGTVRSRLHRARRKVREALGGTGTTNSEHEGVCDE